MFNPRTVYPYLKRIELGGGASQVPFLSPMALSVGDNGDSLVARLFSHEAAAFYLVDDDSHFTYAQTRDLEEAGMSADDLHAVAVSNLERIAETLQPTDFGGGVMFGGNGSLEASVLLAPSFWERLGEQFPNGVVTCIAARDILAVCDAANQDGITSLQVAGAGVWQRGGDHLLAKSLYRRDADGSWSPLDQQAAVPTMTPPSSPSAAAAPSTPPPTAASTAPSSRGDAAGPAVEEIVVSDRELGGNLSEAQIRKLFASGYRFNPTTKCFHRIFAGEPGAPLRPWTEDTWAPKARKRGLFRRG